MLRRLRHTFVWGGAIFLALYTACLARPTCCIMASHCNEATQRRPMDGGAYGSPGFPFLQPSLLYIIQSRSLIMPKFVTWLSLFGEENG